MLVGVVAPAPSEATAPKVHHLCSRVVRPSSTGVVQLLVDSLAPGQTGCLRAGSYVEDVNVRRSHVVLRSFPGEHATLVGRLGFANDASDDVVTNMTLDGRSGLPLPSVTVKGSFIRFVADDVTNENTHNCFVIGSSSGRARGIVIERSRIHHCGALPPTNQMHGIYVADADGTRIVGNVIYGNADRGIQLYPDAQGTLIERNVIDANGTGVIFSGAGGTASSGTTVQYNVISNANVRADVESWYPSGNPMGVGNVVRDNCLFGGTEGTIVSHFGGFTASANVVADPHFANAARGDFRMPRSSVCRRILERRPWR